MAIASEYIASDQVYVYSCSKCEEHDLNIEAQHFCPECEHYLCDKCVKQHNEYHSKHMVYGRSDIQKWAVFSIDRCDQHGKELEVHCDDHQELCCHVCVALNHRQCSSISHLPDMARGFLKTKEFTQLPAAVDKMSRRLDELKNVRTKDQASLNDLHKAFWAEIKSFRKEINNILDQLEKKAVEELNSMIKDLEKGVKDDVEKCAQMHDQIKTMMKKVQLMSDKHKETNSYIGYKRCQGQLTKGEGVIYEIEARPKPRVLFFPKRKIDTFLKGLDNLGNTVCTNVYSCISVKEVYVLRFMDDSFFTGICEMPNGDIVFTDSLSKSVVLLNSQYKVIDRCYLPGCIDCLCHTVGNEVCVAVFIEGVFTKKSEIHFLKVTKGKQKKVRKFTIDQRCNSIAHHQGQLYVIYGNNLYQYTVYGELVDMIYEQQNVNTCAVSPDGERIYVTSLSAQRLLTLDKSGQVLSTLEDPELKDPYGVCVNLSGYVFVCGMGSHTVLQVDRNGRHKLATVAKRADGLHCPGSVSFSEQTSSVLVGASSQWYCCKVMLMHM
ncbi:uncharacterized protein LOC128235208 [Mya arenaria]|uniref:uncharacterized protein LOC128235208 n=1 Tax=Mya arenaria TaxID=6604 RepID=UPI0022E4F655|nr:uncharacterized protein LOC128235208 [Mya arenaria]